MASDNEMMTGSGPDTQPGVSPGPSGINQGAIKGEPGTGYEPGGDLGEFECENCSHFTAPNSCNQDDMKAKSQQPKNPDGSVQVDPEGCCEFVDRIGKQESAEQEQNEGESTVPPNHPLQQLRAKPKGMSGL